MNRHKPKVRKIGRYEAIDWSKLVGKQISTYWSSKPQLVCKNGTLEEKLLALSRLPYGFREYGYFIAHCADREYKQFCTSHDPYVIYPEDANRALEKLQQEIGWEWGWGKVTTFEFIHTHQKGLYCYDPLSLHDIEVADGLAERLYPKGVKNIIMTVASENGYSFKYFPSPSAFNSKYRKTKVK